MPKLLEEGDSYIDIEYIEMTELSRLLRDTGGSKQKKLELTRKAAAEIRKIHDAGFELGDVNVHNIGCTPDERIVLFDFEHQFINGSREKDYSTFAGSAVYEIPDSSGVKDILESIADGYGKDLTHKISIMPYAYLVFVAENRLGNLYELVKMRKYKIHKTFTKSLM